jgi:endo-1,4-beta-xylanase
MRARLSRRVFLGSSAAIALAGCAVPPPLPPPPQPVDLESLPPLRALAAERGLFYGAATTSRLLERDAAFAAAFVRECGLVVPENEAKWDAIEPAPGLFDFSGMNRLAEFARQRGMLVRGHCLVWHNQLAPWVAPALKSDDPRNLLEAHVRRVVEQYRGAIHSWDVVNEAVELNDGRPDGLRRTPFLDAMGPGYIDHAFRVARDADPQAKLVYNDYGLENAEVWNARKRAAVLELLRGLRARAVPVDALGLQAHLKAGQPFDPAGLRAFIGAVAALGLEVYVTELDVSDARLPDDANRDLAVAQTVRDFLGAVLAEPSVRGIVTWGLSDRFSWLNTQYAGDARRADGEYARGLPLDGAMRRTPLWAAIRDSLGARAIGYNSDRRGRSVRQG